MADKIKTKEQILDTLCRLHAEAQRIVLCRYEDGTALRKLCGGDSALAKYADALEAQGKSSRARNLREEMDAVRATTVEEALCDLKLLHELQMDDQWLEDPKTRNILIGDLFRRPSIIRELKKEDLPGVCYLRLLETVPGAWNHTPETIASAQYSNTLHAIAALQDPQTVPWKLAEEIRRSPERMDLRDMDWCCELLTHLEYLSKRFNVFSGTWMEGNRFCHSARIFNACREAGLDVTIWEREKKLCADDRKLAREIRKLLQEVTAYRDALWIVTEEMGGFMLEDGYHPWCWTYLSVVDCIESADGQTGLPTYVRKIVVSDDVSEISVPYSDSLWELLKSGEAGWEAWKKSREN